MSKDMNTIIGIGCDFQTELDEGNRKNSIESLKGGEKDKVNWMISNNYVVVLGLVIWIFMFLKFISSPDFIYGYSQLQVKINSDKINYVKLNDVWIL